jgi:hypothetical protein
VAEQAEPPLGQGLAVLSAGVTFDRDGRAKTRLCFGDLPRSAIQAGEGIVDLALSVVIADFDPT